MVLAAAVLCLPILNPDVYWQLSAGREILAHWRIPRFDAFSFTQFGQPWIDFEWGTQIVWRAVQALLGWRGLWALKGVILAAAYWPVDQFLRDKKASRAARAAGLAFWTASILTHADLRADLISAIFFAVILRRLEAKRAGFLFGFFLFAAWANLHGGFVVGLALYPLYLWLGAAPLALVAAEFFGAVLGTFLNPYGVGLYGAFTAHLNQPGMSGLIMEWGHLSFHRSYQAPLIAAIALVGAIFAVRRRVSALAVLALILGAATAFSVRFGIYFAAAGAMYAASAYARPRLGAVAAGLAALTALLIYPLSHASIGPAITDFYVADRAVNFLARNQDELGPLKLFNQYEWGGAIEWQLGAEHKVFSDGRYLFFDQLRETNQALTAPSAMEAFTKRYALDGFFIQHYPTMLSTRRAFLDGTSLEFYRPWYVLFYPRDRWALVYWDKQALIFVDRNKVSSGWLAAHEYRWFLPGDDAARNDALKRFEIPLGAFAKEQDRHAYDLR